MMGLKVKFNIILLLVFTVSFFAVSFMVHHYLQQQTIDEAERAALLTLDATVIGHIDAKTATALGSRLVNMKISEVDDAGNVLNQPQTGAESAAIKATMSQFKTSANNQVRDVFSSNGEDKHLVVARKIVSVDNNTKIRVVTVDLQPVLATLNTQLATVLSALGVVFFTVFLVLNILLDRFIMRPIAKMAKQADAVSIGNFSIPEFIPKSKDEIGILATAFNRMRRSTEEAIRLL